MIDRGDLERNVGYLKYLHDSPDIKRKRQLQCPAYQIKMLQLKIRRLGSRDDVHDDAHLLHDDYEEGGFPQKETNKNQRRL